MADCTIVFTELFTFERATHTTLQYYNSDIIYIYTSFESFPLYKHLFSYAYLYFHYCVHVSPSAIGGFRRAILFRLLTKAVEHPQGMQKHLSWRTGVQRYRYVHVGRQP